MPKGKNGNGHRLIAEGIARLAETSDDAENWRELAEAMGRDKDQSLLEREESLLRTTKAMRAAGVIDGPKALYLVASCIFHIAEDRRLKEQGPALKRISKAMDEVKKSHGLADDEEWLKGEGPDDWNKLSDEYDRVSDEISAATFDECGEPELGKMYRYDRDRFDELFEEGRQKVFETPPIKHKRQ